MLTLVDRAAPSRLREAFLRLHARDPATDLIVDVQQLAELPLGTTVMLAITPSISAGALAWLNLNRPVIADRRLNIVLWCEGDEAAVLARGAPDFFDWISARVDCPPAPTAFAVADVKAAIRARVPGIAWAGPGLEETLAAVRPGRPIRRVAIDSYESMIDALTSRERGWLVLDGINSDFHLRRLQWAMAETGRRVIVFRRAGEKTLPGWRTVQAEHLEIADAVKLLAWAGGRGPLAALTGLDPLATAIAVSLLRRGIGAARLEQLLTAPTDPFTTLQAIAQSPDRHTAEPARIERDDDAVVATLRESPPGSRPWVEIGTAALEGGDFEAARRWLTRGNHLLAQDASPALVAFVLLQRGQACHRAGDLAAARDDLEQAYSIAGTTQDPVLIAKAAAYLGHVLLDQGDMQRASSHLESGLAATASLGDHEDVAALLDMLAMSRLVLGDRAGARQHLERALSIKQRIFATEDHASIASSLGALGGMHAGDGDLERARSYFERSLEISERLGRAEHPLTMATLGSLAQLHWQAGEPSTALGYLDRVEAMQRAILGASHPGVAKTLVMRAGVLAGTGEMDGAQANLIEALAIQQKAFGDDGQLAGTTTRQELASVLVAKGDLTGAIENLQQALAALRRILERDDHPDVVAAQRELERLQVVQREVQRPD